MKFSKIINEKITDIINICNLKINDNLTDQDKRDFIKNILIRIYNDSEQIGYKKALKDVKEMINEL